MSLTKRNQEILRFAKANRRRMSFTLIGKRFGVSRGLVSGLLFRDEHKGERLCRSPGANGNNKLGTGYRAARYYPEKTTVSAR